MILRDLKDYLIATRRAALADLAARFQTDPDALRGMLAHWQEKGSVRRLDDLQRCGGGCHCSAARLEIYEWVGERADRTAPSMPEASPCASVGLPVGKTR
jgi:hypothetical protein